jgi:hypothetical protein
LLSVNALEASHVDILTAVLALKPIPVVVNVTSALPVVHAAVP